MGLFNTRKPRGYRRVSIYTDDRKEKLEKLVNQVKREQGEQRGHSSTIPQTPKSTRRNPTSLHGP